MQERKNLSLQPRGPRSAGSRLPARDFRVLCRNLGTPPLQTAQKAGGNPKSARHHSQPQSKEPEVEAGHGAGQVLPILPAPSLPFLLPLQNFSDPPAAGTAPSCLPENPSFEGGVKTLPRLPLVEIQASFLQLFLALLPSPSGGGEPFQEGKRARLRGWMLERARQPSRRRLPAPTATQGAQRHLQTG